MSPRLIASPSKLKAIRLPVGHALSYGSWGYLLSEVLEPLADIYVVQRDLGVPLMVKTQVGVLRKEQLA